MKIIGGAFLGIEELRSRKRQQNCPACLSGILLKALWGGHTAALQFMLGIQLQAGEKKHAIRDRRFARGRQDADMHAMYLADSVRRTYLCEAGSNCCVSARSTFFKKCESRSELEY